MSILENAKAAFASRRAELQKIDVPEWGATIYYRAMTMKQKMAIYEGDPAVPEIAVRTVLYRALNEEGQPLFRPADRVELVNHVDPQIIERVALAMHASEFSQGDAEKK